MWSQGLPNARSFVMLAGCYPPSAARLPSRYCVLRSCSSFKDLRIHQRVFNSRCRLLHLSSLSNFHHQTNHRKCQFGGGGGAWNSGAKRCPIPYSDRCPPPPPRSPSLFTVMHENEQTGQKGMFHSLQSFCVILMHCIQTTAVFGSKNKKDS